jgi:enoyl reductase-like protein
MFGLTSSETGLLIAMFINPMPFDLAVSHGGEKAFTSSLIEDSIVAAAWEGTYMGPTGGILTVRSKLAEPIHKAVTRKELTTRC